MFRKSSWCGDIFAPAYLGTHKNYPTTSGDFSALLCIHSGSPTHPASCLHLACALSSGVKRRWCEAYI